jgi:hypothetical protein
MYTYEEGTHKLHTNKYFRCVIIAGVSFTSSFAPIYIDRKFHTYVGRKFLYSGPNPTTSIYDASVVNIYNATGSLARFEKRTFSSVLKNAVAYYNAGVVAVNLKVVGLAPGMKMKCKKNRFTLQHDISHMCT